MICFYTDEENNEFSTITLAKKKSSNTKPKANDIISSLFTMNHELWQVIIVLFLTYCHLLYILLYIILISPMNV